MSKISKVALTIVPVGEAIDKFSGVRHRKTREITDIFNKSKRVSVTQNNNSLIDAMRRDYREMFKWWGISDYPEAIQNVRRGLFLDACVYLIAAALFVVVLLTDVTCLFYWASLGWTPVFLLSSAKRFWQYDCITNRQFMLFREWAWRG